MSRPIKMTEQYLKECREDFEKALKLTKLADGKLSFTKMFSCGDQKATVYFTPEAWTKMVTLLREFDKEVAWHGVAERTGDESANEYTISDILVYPQTVSGASVEMDTEEYAKWLMENADDERFNNIHMQGHSHVNMATNPSSVDLNHQEEILNMLGDEDFYIFMIWNKSLANNIKIYDLKKNILFEDKDVTYHHDDGEMDAFLKAAKEMVKTKTYQYGGYNGYGSGSYQVKQGTGTAGQSGSTAGKTSGGPYNPLSSTASATKDDDKDDKKSEKKDDSGKKDSKKGKTRSKIGAGWNGAEDYHQRTMFDYEDDEYGDDEDDNWPYGHGGYYGGYYGR